MMDARYKNMWTFLTSSKYGDAADIGSDMRCTICTRILINAYNSVCGCRYCLECVKAYLNSEKRFCPGNTDDCKVEELEIDRNILPDNVINNRISKLIVACRYSCGRRCELKNMEEHEQTCERQPIDCPYVNVGCRETRLVTDRFNEHLGRENESHARLLMKCIDRLESEIASMKRNTTELRSEMAEMRLAREMDEVRARETNELVDQIKQEVANLKNENQLTKKENNTLKVEIEKYRTEYLGLAVATDHQLAEFQANRQRQEREIEMMTEKYNEGEEKLSELDRQTRKEKENLRRNIDEVQEKQTSELNNLEKRVREIEINTNQTEFVWSIDEWAAKSQSAKNGSCDVIFSEAFFSHKNGYQMCLSVYPDGCGTRKGTHLSVYFHLMRGPFDNILPWPFKRNVTLSLINQHTSISHDSYTMIYDDFPNHVNWNKPSREKNSGFGFSKLIELATLTSIGGLCHDDKLFIRCTVK